MRPLLARPKRGGERSWSPLRLTIILILTSVYIYPFLFMVATALKPTEQYYARPAGWPTSLTFSHVQYAWSHTSPGLGRAMVNSLVAVSIGTVLCCVLTSLAAFWFLRNRSKISNVLLATFGSLWVVPQVIWVVPFFLILSALNLTDNLLVLGVVYGASAAPSFIWLLWTYFLQGVPDEVLQAAEVDGASMFQQYWKIALPLSLPALGAVAALTFVYSWGDLVVAVVMLQSPAKFTATLAGGTLVGRFNPSVQDSTAAALITMAPSVLIFLFAQKAMVRGITTGVSK